MERVSYIEVKNTEDKKDELQLLDLKINKIVADLNAMPKNKFIDFTKPPKDEKNAEAKAKRFMRLADKIEDIRTGMRI